MPNKLEIESAIRLDEDMSYFNYNENLERVNEDTLLYTDWGNLSNEFPELEVDRGQFYHSGTQEIFEKIFDREGFLEDFKKETEGLSEDEQEDAMIEFFEQEFINSKFYDYQTVEKLDYLKELKENGLDIVTNWDNYDYVYTPGYSQGDGINTVINTKEVEKVWGKKPDLSTLKSNISNYIFDAPMSIRINVNNEEYISEKDGYYDHYENYDSSKIQEEFSKMILDDNPMFDKDLINEALNDVIPSEIEINSNNVTTTIYNPSEKETNEGISDFLKEKIAEGYRFDDDGNITQTPDDLKNQSQSQTLK